MNKSEFIQGLVKTITGGIVALACIGAYNTWNLFSGADRKANDLAKAHKNIERNAYALGQWTMTHGAPIENSVSRTESLPAYQKFVLLDKDSVELYFTDINKNNIVDSHDRLSVSHRTKGYLDSYILSEMNANRWATGSESVREADSFLERLATQTIPF